MSERSNKILFLIGWILSPFSWWNDPLVNIPLSYIIANLVTPFLALPFVWLVIGAYWATNIIGILLLYVSGERLVSVKGDRVKTITFVTVSIIAYSLVMFILDRLGWLVPLSALYKKW